MQQLILGVLVQLDDQLCLKIHLLVYIEKLCLLSRGCLAMVFNLPQGMSNDKLGELHPAAAAEFRPFGLRSFTWKLNVRPPACTDCFLANLNCLSSPFCKMLARNLFLQCSSQEDFEPHQIGAGVAFSPAAPVPR